MQMPQKNKSLSIIIRFFNAFDIDRQSYLDWNEFTTLIKDLGLKTVPVISESFFLSDKTIQDIILMADGKSELNKDQYREGLVFKTKFNTSFGYGKMSFKSISNKFLLKYED